MVSRAPTPPSVIAIFGPTGAGKTAVAEALAARLDGDVVSADSAAVYRGLPVISAAPAYPTRIVGVFELEHEVSVAEYQRLAHQAIDAIVEAGRLAILTGGTGLYFRAALSSFEFPPAPGPGVRERFAEEYDRLGPEEAHALLAERDPAAAVRIHANDRRRVVRALELAEAGHSLVPAENRLWTDDVRLATLVVALEVSPEELERRIRARCTEMVAQGAIEEARQAWDRPLSETARKVIGVREFATLAPEPAVDAVVAATLRLARYQRKWIRRVPGAVMVNAECSPQEIADDIVALASPGERLPGD